MNDEEYRAYVKSVVDQAPPLTADQCALISRVMYPKGWSIIPPGQAVDQIAA